MHVASNFGAPSEGVVVTYAEIVAEVEPIRTRVAEMERHPAVGAAQYQEAADVRRHAERLAHLERELHRLQSPVAPSAPPTAARVSRGPAAFPTAMGGGISASIAREIILVAAEPPSIKELTTAEAVRSGAYEQHRARIHMQV